MYQKYDLKSEKSSDITSYLALSTAIANIKSDCAAVSLP